MPHPARPSLTLAVEVPDHHALAQRFDEADIPPLTVEEAGRLARLRVAVPADASKAAVEVSVQFAASGALPSRLLLAKLIAGGVGELYAMNYDFLTGVLVGQFAAVAPRVVAA
jgi:hypothetical protein